jgi:hypothetical protein
MSWHLIAWSIQNSAKQPLWDSSTLTQQASEISMWFISKKPTSLWFSVFWKWRLLHRHVEIHEQNGRICASQLLIFLLTNKITCSTFMYSTVKVLCVSMNRLSTVWQCTEILLYRNRWGVLDGDKSKCSQISSPPRPPPTAHYHHHYHHHQYIFGWTTNCIAEKEYTKPTLHYIHYEHFSTIMIISHSALPKIRNVSNKICLEIQTHFM